MASSLVWGPKVARETLCPASAEQNPLWPTALPAQKGALSLRRGRWLAVAATNIDFSQEFELSVGELSLCFHTETSLLAGVLNRPLFVVACIACVSSSCPT